MLPIVARGLLDLLRGLRGLSVLLSGGLVGAFRFAAKMRSLRIAFPCIVGWSIIVVEGKGMHDEFGGLPGHFPEGCDLSGGDIV